MRIHSNWLTLGISIYFFFGLNIDFIRQITHILSALEHHHIGFILSVPIAFIAAFNAVFILFSLKFLEKWFFGILLISSSIISYATYNYHVIFDANMIANVMQTYSGELLSYLNLTAFGWVIFFGLAPTFILFKTKITHFSFFKDLGSKLIIFIISCLITGSIVFKYYEDYTALGRNNSHLIKMITPFSQLTSFYKYIYRTHLVKPLPYRNIGLDALNQAPPSHKKTLFVLAIGETARSMNYELNGYAQPTNQHSKSFDLISFKEVSSCGTATAISLPCMFSNMGRTAYAPALASTQDNLLNILDRAGLQLFWMDNDGGCKGVCDKIPHLDISPSNKIAHCDEQVCVDEILIDHLQEKIATLKPQDTLLALHLIGSHGPTYYKRYPLSHQKFIPDCQRSDIQNCSAEALVNTYDNTILYTDYILSQAIQTLQKSNDQWNTVLLYVSDHGESLGEKGLYLHGLPYSIAPKEQTQVPMMVWFSEGFAAAKKITPACVKHRATHESFTHDNLFHSILGLMDISTSEYQTGLDIFAPCRGISDYK